VVTKEAYLLQRHVFDFTDDLGGRFLSKLARFDSSVGRDSVSGTIMGCGRVVTTRRLSLSTWLILTPQSCRIMY
jgi:hypothetical protein